ncbi:MAG: DUF2270 domain-containing protein [Chloroflexota bacterium]
MVAPGDSIPPKSSPFSADSGPSPAAGDDPSGEFVWTFRGYRLRASEFTTAMVHMFRAEVQRANVWRQRLDTTTNWAVVTTGAAISFAFSSTGSHVVILLNILLVTIFLTIEARRYRYYELWAYRVRLMETDFFAPMLVPPFHPSPDWAESLSENLLHPNFPISQLEALGRRLRRNYLAIYSIIGATWLTRLILLPEPAASWADFVARAGVGFISGRAVLGIALLFTAAVLAVSFGTLTLQTGAGEVLPRFGDDFASRVRQRAWFRPSHRRPQLLTLIITDQQTAVADRILQDMRRGVTSLPGTGMYTGAPHPLLMIALTVTEVPQLKALVAEVDPKAFVIVIPAQEILGRGFMPLNEDH